MQSVAKKLVRNDIFEALVFWRIWFSFAVKDVKMRYRRSVLGPFWITISMTVRIYSMGFLYSHLFHVNTATYLPYLATGIIAWGFVSTLLTESISAFSDAEVYIKNFNLSLMQYIFRMVFRNFIALFHNLFALLPLFVFYDLSVGVNTLLIFPVLFFISLSGIFYGALFSMLGVRFRDFSQLVSSLLQVIFFLTPIMWQASVIPAKYQLFVTLNPFAQLVDLIRQPLINQSPSGSAWLMLVIITLIGLSFYLIFYARFRDRVVFWV